MSFSERLFSAFFNSDEGGGGGGGSETTTETETKTETGGGGKSYDEAHVSKLNRENAEHRRKVRELEAKLKEREDADLSETDKLKKRAEEAEARVTASQVRIAKAEVKAAAAAAKIVDPEAAYKLVRDDITFDKDGEPENVDALIADLVKKSPYLLGAGDGGGGSAMNGARGKSMSREAAAELARKDPKEFNRRVNAGEIDLSKVWS